MLSEIVEKSHGHHREEEKTEVVRNITSNAIRRTTLEAEAPAITVVRKVT